jgi:hypothetical protein
LIAVISAVVAVVEGVAGRLSPPTESIGDEDGEEAHAY